MKQIKTTFNYTMGMMALAAVFSLGCSAPDATTTTDVAPTTQEVAPAPEAPAAPQLTDPERGWREAEVAIDAAVRKFGPSAVQRAALTRRRGARTTTG